MPNTANIETMFPWLTRTKIGMRYGRGGPPIGWYQQHQMCAIKAIEEAASLKLGLERNGYEVRAKGTTILARPGGAPRGTRFVRIGTASEFYSKASSCSR
jgi:hypothetical protein